MTETAQETNLPFEKIKREILVRREAETSPLFGCAPEKRTTENLIKYGVVNINKPRGPTSHQVSAYVQKILDIPKAGHSGTLDPNVTGVLPVALHRATKTAQALLKAGKEYVGIMHLHREVDGDKIKTTINDFIGNITQLPPVRSAVRRQERVRTIYYFKILEISEKDILFVVGCQAGTYIRKLCLHPQTEILTEKGIKNILDFCSLDFCSDVSEIYSFNQGAIIKKKPSKTQKIPSPKKLIKINMSSGVSIIVTPDHELLVSEKKGYNMKEVQKLKKGDYLVKSLIFPQANNELIIPDLLDDYFYIQQREIKEQCKKAFISKYGSIRKMYHKLKLDRKTFLSKSNNAVTIRHLKLAGIYEKVKNDIYSFKTQKGKIINLKELNANFFYLLGLIASDGNNTKEKKTVRYTRIKFHNKEECLVNKFMEIYKNLFPTIPISKKKFRENLWQLDTTNSFFATIAASLGIKSPQKNSDLLPILNTKPKFIKAFLKGYFDGDGSAYFKKKEKILGHHNYIRFHTGNFCDADRIHKMLLKIGIPNKIFNRVTRIKNRKIPIFDISIESLAGKRKFINEIGSNHPFKINKFNEIMKIKDNSDPYDHCYVGFHFKEYIKENKSKLNKLGGNLHWVLNNTIPITRKFYKRASTLVKLPKLDEFVIEKIKSIEKVQGTDYVYDMTVPDTHNFLIETGFVSSNCHDIGQKLGVGAHMAELRRTKAGPFDEENMISMQDLQDAFWYYKNNGSDAELKKCIQPMESAVLHLPKVWVLDTAVNSICHGANLKFPGVSKLHTGIAKDDLVAVMSLKDELVALGAALCSSKEILKLKKGVAVRVDKVLMEPGVYPRIEKK